MASIIHPSAIVSPTAKLGDNCYIGPFCYVGPNVTMGKDNRLEAYVSVGTNAEHRDYFHSEPGEVIIGDANVFREYVTINAGTKSPTTVGSKCVLLRGSHIGHDAEVRNFATLSCNVLIGGHTIIGQGANLGLNAVIHQHRAIGAYGMVGMNSTVTRNLPPFLIAYGTPARPQRVNRIGLLRAGILESEIVIFENWFQTQEETGGLSPLTHKFNNLLNQYLRDCQTFQVSSPVAA